MSNVSDGYHTFDELYKHRAYLFAALCESNRGLAWWSKRHPDGTMFDGMFIAGMTLPGIGDISYHIENSEQHLFKNITEYDYAPKFDGYSSDDVLERLANYFITDEG